MSDLYVDTWGTGTPVVLVHGGLATGAEWQEQKPLTEEGYQLLVPDRRGYGNSPAVDGEDFLRDADDITEIIGDDGAHVVAHSYGGLGAMFAAARRPEAILSLALLEPPAFTMTSDDAARRLVDRVRSIWDEDTPEDEWLLRFFEAVGTDPATVPDEILEEATPKVPLVRRGRTAWDREPPVADLRTSPYPKLVVSGGHSTGFDAICDELAGEIGASRAEVAGADHEIQFTGAPLNQLLLGLWSQPARGPSR